ncbi:hypothetical protein A3K86_02895 [Photobacterium jeanii]|uniref:DUF2987 domain-containing protein n=1 Tax=Photobacterium jeanii TaxID=858640 RepID=A0A178KMU6_9GAMM|nr:DUF2987 domain-containing protein [Photobacterium jeanii]OAN17882.1 hypothetical protein A3K86_02895 [Photobacterium jeanii]PST92451.1 DUF2987 domain-containing protein [Photobacterium jeanii]
MKFSHWLVAGCCASALVFSSVTQAQEVQLRYSNLYSKLKQNYKEGHDDVRIALFLLDQQTGKACKVYKGWMQKEEHFEELVIPANNELVVPVDKNLRQANPDVTFVIDDGVTCDMSMQVIANTEYGKHISREDIMSLVPQMNNMLSDLGGMFSSWFMPSVEGVVLHFPEQADAKIVSNQDTPFQLQDGKLVLKLSQLKANESLPLPVPPSKVTPWLPPN